MTLSVAEPYLENRGGFTSVLLVVIIRSIGDEARVVEAEVCTLLFPCSLFGLNWVCLSAKLEVACRYEEPPHFPLLFLSTASSACLFVGLNDAQLSIESGVILEISLAVVLRASSSDCGYEDLETVEGFIVSRLSRELVLCTGSGSSNTLSSISKSSISKSSIELSRVACRVSVLGGDGWFRTSFGVPFSDLLVREFLRCRRESGCFSEEPAA